MCKICEENSEYDGKPSTGNKKKKTRRWCKGKVGVEHDWSEWECIYPARWGLRALGKRVCKKCSKEKWSAENGGRI